MLLESSVVGRRLGLCISSCGYPGGGEWGGTGYRGGWGDGGGWGRGR
ncbi:unnamed protein product [Penicillium camemberti]|uniref:Str. FM013 n=1 Tax=Penicillium camemberti (strain FM 013) TaxID=1429867 RepID=A0A0G4P3K5_PENC3|nr:unnamed protein product [Penicillium camemberti]